ncbi:MAG: helix-turn-helix transcriptional regulator [Myxococcales bacterium]|nr:helix-turn-helix transcriptional regulator [Myxococcales bacterium]MCB9643430.1 helix-turn-helix transcriptional regulator [Myxococcales bacterium]
MNKPNLNPQSTQYVGIQVQEVPSQETLEDPDKPSNQNNVQKLREAMLMSKAELARKAGVSALTIDRVERGNPCRMDTKRKILLALGMKLSERKKVFLDPSEE